MATIPTLTYLPSDESVILQLLSRPLPADADLFDVADNCAALVSVLVETDNATSRTVLTSGWNVSILKTGIIFSLLNPP